MPDMSIVIRPLEWDDLPALAAMLNVASEVDQDGFHYTAEELRHSFDRPGIELPASYVVVVTSDGQLAGFCNAGPQHDYGEWSWGSVHPAFRRQGIGSRLIAAADAQATYGRSPVTIERITLDTLTGTIALFEAQGYRRLRDHYDMRIALDQPIEAPLFPEGIALRPFVPERDGRAVWEAHQEAFQDHWGHRDTPFERWTHDKHDDPRFDPALWFIAVAGDQIAGLAICRRWDDARADLGHVDELAVRRPWRKRGLGLALLRHSFHVMQRRGFTQARLGVDAESESNAAALYERAGMHVHQRWVIYRKVMGHEG